MESLVSGPYSVCLRPPKRRDLSIHGMLLISGPVIFIESLLWQSVKRDTGNSRDWLILLKWSDEVWNMFPLPGEWWPLPPWHGLVTVYSLHEDVQSQLVLPQPNPPHPSAWQTELQNYKTTNWTAVSRVEGRKFKLAYDKSLIIFFPHISYRHIHIQQIYYRDIAFGLGCHIGLSGLAFIRI